MSDYWLDTKDAADYLKLSPRTLETWRVQSRGPRFHRIGALVRYSRSDLDAFVLGVDPSPSAPAAAMSAA